MSNKLTSLTGFGEGDPKPEKGNKPMFESGKKYKYNEVASKWNAHMESKNAKSSALNKKMGKGSGKNPHYFGTKNKSESEKLQKSFEERHRAEPQKFKRW